MKKDGKSSKASACLDADPGGHRVLPEPGGQVDVAGSCVNPPYSGPTPIVGVAGSRKRGRTAGGGTPVERSNTPTGQQAVADGGLRDTSRVVANRVDEETRDTSQEGWSFFDGLMRTDEEFRLLIGCFTTLYAVKRRKVSGLSAKSFKAAKERVVTFIATTSPWAVQGPTGDRRWGRGPLHQEGSVQGRTDGGDVRSLGGRSSGLRSPRSCPSCGCTARATFRTREGIRCPGCAGRGNGPHASGPGGELRPQGPSLDPKALEVLVDGDA